MKEDQQCHRELEFSVGMKHMRRCVCVCVSNVSDCSRVVAIEVTTSVAAATM